MIAEILCVGTEILLGDIVNTNAQYIAKQLAHLGIEVHFQTVVGDNPKRLSSALNIAMGRADMVILTGGLGPTKDDLTKEILAEFFAKPLVLDQKALNMLTERLRHRLGADFVISDSNRKQAYLPEGALVLYNDNGTAPGCVVEGEIDGQMKRAVLLPGPPREMAPMFQQCRVRYLQNLSDRIFLSVNVRLQGISEANAGDRVAKLLDNANPTVAPYAKEDGIILRVTAAAHDEAEARKLMAPVLDELRQLLGEHFKCVEECD